MAGDVSPGSVVGAGISVVTSCSEVVSTSEKSVPDGAADVRGCLGVVDPMAVGDVIPRCGWDVIGAEVL